MDVWVGVDLGQLRDYTAAAVMRRTLAITPDVLPERDSCGRPCYRFDVIALKRYELGTSYEAVVAHLADQLRRPEFLPWTRLVIDATGVGRPVLERFRTALASYGHVEVWGITITGGLSASPVRCREWNVAKQELVGALRAAMGTRRLTIPDRLPMADVIRKEAAAFQVKVSRAAHEIYSAREGAHDDLLLSVAMPIWMGGQPWAQMTEGAEDLDRERQALTAEEMAERAALAREIEAERLAAEEARTRPFWDTDSLREWEAKMRSERNPFDDLHWGEGPT